MTTKTGFWIVGLLSLLFLFATCTQDNVQPIISSDDTELEFRANAETPFKAAYETTFTSSPPPSPIPLHIWGEGKGTHLGKNKFYSDSWFGEPGEQFGNIIFYAANGDELYAYFAGSVNPNPPLTFFEGEFMLGYWADGPGIPVYPKDGTGRFAGATGNGDYTGWGNLVEQEGEIEFDGVLINP